MMLYSRKGFGLPHLQSWQTYLLQLQTGFAAGQLSTVKVKRIMRKVWAIYVLLLISSAASMGADQQANANKRGQYAKSIDQVSLLDANDVDLATAALIVSEQWSSISRSRYLIRLDEMVSEFCSKYTNGKLPAGPGTIRMLNEYLFDELGFKSVSDANDPNDLFLHSVLDRKRGYCLSLSILYLSIGERLGLPLYGVVVPGHLFVRYDDGSTRFNIEPTNKGRYTDDKHYIEKFRVPAGNDKSIYMRNLNKMQTVGCLLNNLGNIYMESGDFDKAMAVLETSVRINPLLSEALINLGNIYMKKGRIKDAISEYQAALKINPAETKAHNNLGNVYSTLDRLPDAVDEYQRSLKLDPNNADVYKSLSGVYCRQKLFSKAAIQLKRAIELQPMNADLYCQLGDVYSQKDDCDAAVVQYKQVLKLRPKSVAAHFGLAVCYGKTGDEDRQIGEYEKALAIEPDMAAALINLGNIYFVKEKYEVALELYKRANRVKPGDSSVHYNLAAAYSNREQYEEAAYEYQAAIRLDAGMGSAHSGLAYAFYRLGRYSMAQKHIDIARQLGTDVSVDLVAAVEARLK